MQAEPTWANIYIRFREEDFGRVSVPGLEIEVNGKVRIYDRVDSALNYIRKLHNDNLKGVM